MEFQGLVLRQVDGRGFYSRVHLTYEKTPDGSSLVTPALPKEDDWEKAQGWYDAAIQGAQLGLTLAESSGRCVITYLHGHNTCDTTPDRVALAAVRAVWAALSFPLSEVMEQRIHDLILQTGNLTLLELEKELRTILAA